MCLWNVGPVRLRPAIRQGLPFRDFRRNVARFAALGPRGARGRREKRCKGLFVSAFPRRSAQRRVWAPPSQKWMPGSRTEDDLFVREDSVRPMPVSLSQRRMLCSKKYYCRLFSSSILLYLQPCYRLTQESLYALTAREKKQSSHL